MISVNDTTILAMLSRYPDMPGEEADSYIAKIENEENISVCHAVIGRIAKEELDDDARRTYEEFHRWSMDRTRRVRSEQWSARQRQKETRMALRMNELHQKGVISEQVLVLYGISGPLPERNMYAALSAEEKEAIWVQRMESRFGPNWRQRFRNLPAILQRRIETTTINWRKEGF